MGTRFNEDPRLKITRPSTLCDGPDVQHNHLSHPRHQLRLIITVPAMLILVALGYGLVSFLAFDQHWNELDSLGAGSVAGELLRTHLITMLVLTVIALVLGVAMAFSILKPIRAIAEASRLAAEGKLNHAVNLPAPTELVDLSLSFNSMIDNLNDTIVKRNRGLLEGLPVGIMVLDTHGTISAFSPVAAEMIDQPVDMIVGQSIENLYDCIDDTRPGLSRRIRVLRNRILDVPLSPGKLDSMPEEAEENGLIVSGSILSDAEQQVNGLVFTFREASPVHDLTDHLERTDRLAALGAFTLGLADELRNPLGAIKGLSQLLILEKDMHPKTEAYLGRMVDEVDRVDGLVQQLLKLGNQPNAMIEETDMAEVIHHALEAAKHELEIPVTDLDRLHVRIDCVPAVRLDGERLVPAFVQIISNAYAFSPAGSPIRIQLHQVQFKRRNWVEIRFHNIGPAISSDNRDKIFDPFFTTRRGAKGLGLTITDQVISQNGGTLVLESGDEGNCFCVRFPLDRDVEPSMPSVGGAAA
jgi:signal transduction histidine kinase